MRLRKLIIALANVAALLTVAVTFSLHNSVVIRAQEVEKQTGIGVTGAMGFIVEWVEPDSPTEKVGIKGFIVESVEPGSLADKVGIKRGDAILSLGGRRLQTMQDVQAAFRNSLNDSNKAIDAVYLRRDPATGRYMIVRTGETTMPTSGVGAIFSPVLNAEAIEKPLPTYPPLAKAARASGIVTVSIVVDEEGRVEKAEAISGHPLLRHAAVEAAYKARFTPTKLSGNPVKLSGVITYNFALP